MHLSRVPVWIWWQLNPDRLHLKLPRQLSITCLSPGDQYSPHLNVRLSEDQNWRRTVLQYCPIINLLCPAVSLPVTQASFPFIRWCSATMQQLHKIQSLQEVGILSLSYVETQRKRLSCRFSSLVLFLCLNNSACPLDLIKRRHLG